MEDSDTSTSRLEAKRGNPYVFSNLPHMTDALKSGMHKLRRDAHCKYDEIPVEDTIRLILELPIPDSEFAHWVKALGAQTPSGKVSDLHILAKADWDKDTSNAGKTFGGPDLLQWFVTRLDKHFAPSRKQHYRLQWVGLKQDGRSPKLLLAHARLCEPHLDESKMQFAVGYYDRLESYIHVVISPKWGLILTSDWYPRLDEMATDAETVWENRRFKEAEQGVGVYGGAKGGGGGSSAAASTSSGGGGSKASAKGNTKAPSDKTASTSSFAFYCTKHGPNISHNTNDCQYLKRKAAAALASALAPNIYGSNDVLGLASRPPLETHKFTPEVWAAAHALATAQQPHSQQQPATKYQADQFKRKAGHSGGGGSGSGGGNGGNGGGGGGQRGGGDRERCDYCFRLHGSTCFIKHPWLAPDNYKPPSPALQSVFDANLRQYRESGGNNGGNRNQGVNGGNGGNRGNGGNQLQGNGNQLQGNGNGNHGRYNGNNANAAAATAKYEDESDLYGCAVTSCDVSASSTASANTRSTCATGGALLRLHRSALWQINLGRRPMAATSSASAAARPGNSNSASVAASACVTSATANIEPAFIASGVVTATPSPVRSSSSGIRSRPRWRLLSDAAEPAEASPSRECASLLSMLYRDRAHARPSGSTSACAVTTILDSNELPASSALASSTGVVAACATHKQQPVPVSFQATDAPPTPFPLASSAKTSAPDPDLELLARFPLSRLVAALDRDPVARSSLAGRLLSEASAAPPTSEPMPASSAAASSASAPSAAAATRGSGAADNAGSVAPDYGGPPYCVVGERPISYRTISDIPPHVCSRLLQQDADASSYFNTPARLFYYARGAVQITFDPDDSSPAAVTLKGGSAPPCHPCSLRDTCADINLIPIRIVRAFHLPTRGSSSRLATGTTTARVGEELATERLSLVLQPGTPYAVRLRMSKTLVVDDTHLFDLLIGNPQMQPVADFITSYPSPMLHYRPNLLEHPDLVVSLPMHNTNGVHNVLASSDISIALCSSSCGSLCPAEKLGGGCDTCFDADDGSSDDGDTFYDADDGFSQGPTASGGNTGTCSTLGQDAAPAKATSWLSRACSSASYVASCASVAASKGLSSVITSMDRTDIIYTTPPKPKRTGKRKKPSPPRDRLATGAKRTWRGVFTFLFFFAALFSMAAGVGATGGNLSGSAGLQAMQQIEAVSAALHAAPPQLRARWRITPDPDILSSSDHPPGLSGVLASVDSFTFDGKMAAAACERYEKDKDGGWVWGHATAMPPEVMAQLQRTVRDRKSSAFAYSMEELPGYCGELGAFRLELTTDKPIIQQSRRYSPKEQEIIRTKTEELLKPGICVEWKGPTKAVVNPVIAAKRDEATGLWTAARMAQDYRPLNKVTQGDKYGLHRPEEIFQRVGKARFFSKLDMRQGFLQIPIHEEDQGKTAFWCGNRIIAYTRMPYGLKNASAAFQRRMDHELRRAGLDHCAISFIDDVLIATETAEEHVIAVGKVLDALSACGLRAHPDKSIFGADVVEYLGHNLSTFGISPHHAKVAAILALSPPKNVSELRTQLGFINYYRCYIPRMSELASPLNHLLKQGVPWRWGPEQEEAHRTIKEVFTQPNVVLKRIDYSRQLILHTDFSNKGIAAVLGQLDDHGQEYMCACISRSLNKHEANYASYKGEMLAVVWAVKMLRHHLIGSDIPFKLVTDHQPLLYLMSSEGLTGQYARFALVLQEYNFTIEHRPGVKHQNADGLSRNPMPTTADGSGARLDEDNDGFDASPLPTDAATALAASAASCQVVHAALNSSSPVAPFASDFLPSPDEATFGWNGWGYESACPQPDDPDLESKVARELLRGSALEWKAARKRRLRDASGAPAAPPSPSPAAVSATRWYDNAYRHGITLYEPLGGLASALDACLLNGIPVKRYYCSEPDREARRAVLQRLPRLTDSQPALLPASAWSDTFITLPPSAADVTEQHLQLLGRGGEPILIAAYWSPGDLGAQAAAVRTVTHAQQLLGADRVMFVCGSTVSVTPAPAIEQRSTDSTARDAWGQPVVVDSARFGSGLHQLYRTWSSLTPDNTLREMAEAATRPAACDAQSALGNGRTVPDAKKTLRPPFYPCEMEGRPVKALMASTVAASMESDRPTSACPIHDASLDLYTAPTAAECESLLGFCGGVTNVPEWSEQQRKALLVRATDVTYLASIIAIGRVLSEDNPSALSDRAPAALVTSTVLPSSGLAYTFSLLPNNASADITSALTSSALESEGMPQADRDAWADDALIAYLRSGQVPTGTSEVEERRVQRRARRYRWQADQLLIMSLDGKARVVPRPTDRGEIVRKMHEQSGHWGVRRTCALILHSYWWRGVKEDVASAVRHCTACDRVKATFTTQPPTLNPLPIGGLFYRWGVDLCGPFTETERGNNYVMVCVEHFSKYVVLIPLPSKSAADTTSAFRQHILGMYGACAEVCTDQGSEWKGEFARLLMESLIDHRQTSANHPQANGLSERAVQTCKRALAKLAHSDAGIKQWDNQLPSITLGYNCSVQSATKLCPYTILYATDPVIPPAIKPRFQEDLNLDDPEAAARSVMLRAAAVRRNMVIAGGNIATAQHRDRLRYARLRGGGFDPKVRKFEIGDYVYYRNTTARTSLEAQARPEILRVADVRQSGVLELEGRCGTKITAHITHVAPCHLPIADSDIDPRLARPSATLSCQVCNMPDNEEWMLLCDACGSGWHTFCLSPPLESIPDGTWICPPCVDKGVTIESLQQKAAKQREHGHLPAQFKHLQGALAMREAKGRRGRKVTDSGVVSYAGLRRRTHHFLIEYSDGTSEVVSLAQLRPRLISSSNKARAAAATAQDPAPRDLSEPQGALRALQDIMPGPHGSSKAEHLSNAARLGNAGLHLSTPSELDQLSSFVELSFATSVYAPWGAPAATAEWIRQQGCRLRRGLPSRGPDASSIEALSEARREGVDMGVVWMECIPSVLDLCIESAAQHAREAVIARAPPDYVTCADRARLTWLRARSEEGRLMVIACATCMWLVYLAPGKRRHGFVRDELITSCIV